MHDNKEICFHITRRRATSHDLYDIKAIKQPGHALTLGYKLLLHWTAIYAITTLINKQLELIIFIHWGWWRTWLHLNSDLYQPSCDWQRPWGQNNHRTESNTFVLKGRFTLKLKIRSPFIWLTWQKPVGVSYSRFPNRQYIEELIKHQYCTQHKCSVLWRKRRERVLILISRYKLSMFQYQTFNPAHFLSKHTSKKRISYSIEKREVIFLRKGNRVEGFVV